MRFASRVVGDRGSTPTSRFVDSAGPGAVKFSVFGFHDEFQSGGNVDLPQPEASALFCEHYSAVDFLSYAYLTRDRARGNGTLNPVQPPRSRVQVWS